MNLVAHFLGRRSGQRYESVQFVGCGQFWLKGLGRSIIGKLVMRRLGKKYMDKPPYRRFIGKECDSICVSHVNVHQKVTLVEVTLVEDLNN